MEATEMELETIVGLLNEREDVHLTAEQLYMLGYEPHHQTFRKQVGPLGISYRQVNRGQMFEFAAIYRIDNGNNPSQ